MATVARNWIRTLKSLGVDKVFGVAGKSIVPLILACKDEGVDFVPARTESGAGFMAVGYALETGNLGVAMVTAGCGGTNIVTPAAQANAYGVPVLFISGANDTKEMGLPISQDSTEFGANLVSLFKSVTKSSLRVETFEMLNSILRHSLNQAFAYPQGAVHVSFPLDIQKVEADYTPYKKPRTRKALDTFEVQEAVSRIVEGKKTVILAGKGVKLSWATTEFIQLVDLLDVPVVTTPAGKGAISTGHKNYAGVYGLGGNPSATALFEQGIDLLLVFGSSLNDFSIAGITPDKYPREVIQFDTNPKFVGFGLPVLTSYVGGDLKTTIPLLISGLEGQVPTTHYENWLFSDSVVEEHTTLHFSDIMKTVNKLKEKEESRSYFVDIGSHGFTAVKYLDVDSKTSFTMDTTLACMGSAIGCAVGSASANNGSDIVCITGDGCFLMLGTEVATAVNEGMGLTFIVCNNGQWDMVTKGMERYFDRTDGTILTTPVHIAKMAEALGAVATRCHTVDDFEKAFRNRDRSQTNVIEVVTDPQEPTPTTVRRV